jgi:DNA-binding GntR family transcriptional regulator
LKPKRRKNRRPIASTLPSRLAQQILQYLREHEYAAGEHLPEQALADHFRVSRTPVRMALQLLAETGIAERHANRGFFVKTPPGAAGATLDINDDEQESLYFKIGEDRLAGRLPQRFTETELMRRYKVTRPQVGRLLRRMSQEGWLERLPGQGWEFQPIFDSPKVYEQGYRFRELIEVAALLEPGYHLDAETIARLRAKQQAMLQGGLLRYSRAETFETGASFHEAVVAGSGNAFLIDTIRRINRLRRLLDYRTHFDRARLVQQCKEHLELLDMIEVRDFGRAAEFLKQHIGVARQLKVGLTGAPAARRGTGAKTVRGTGRAARRSAGKF